MTTGDTFDQILAQATDALRTYLADDAVSWLTPFLADSLTLTQSR
jgi:predicted RNase H-like HicB family nuclease